MDVNGWDGWLVAAAAIFWLAGTVKGVVGLGLPTVAMALLAMLMTPAQAAALLIVPSLITNVWQMRPWPAVGALLRRLGGMQCGICVGTWLRAGPLRCLCACRAGWGPWSAW